MAKAPSKVDRLPAEVRELISELRQAHHWTLDEITSALRKLAEGGRPNLPGTLPAELLAPPSIDPEQLPSRSGLHRHIQGLDQLAERVTRSRTVAEALVRRLGDAPEDRQMRLNIELMHSVVMDLFLAQGSGDEEGGQVVFDAKTVHDLAKALDHLSRASANDAAHILKLRQETEKKTKDAAAKAVEKMAHEKGLTKDTVNSIKAQILGVRVA